MTRILLQRRQSVANNAIQNCAFLRGGEEKDLENEKKKKRKKTEREDVERYMKRHVEPIHESLD